MEKATKQDEKNYNNSQSHIGFIGLSDLPKTLVSGFEIVFLFLCTGRILLFDLLI